MPDRCCVRNVTTVNSRSSVTIVGVHVPPLMTLSCFRENTVQESVKHVHLYNIVCLICRTGLFLLD